MIKSFVGSWPLFVGLGLLMVSNGLQGTLLGLRAALEGFDTLTIGLIMSFYYLGFLGGSHFTPRLIMSVGHIRVFTALASLASSTVLLHGLFVEPVWWMAARLVTGFCYAGLYIVVESWLSDKSTPKTRGKMFSLYQFITYGGMALGQYMLALAAPTEIELFVYSSILVSIALLPVALSSRPAPDISQPELLPLRKLFHISPLGLIAVFLVGLGTSAVFSLVAVYGNAINLTVVQISNLVAFYLIGAVAAQIPIGLLSDRFDRRRILIGISALACLAGLGCYLAGENVAVLYVFIFLFGMVTLPIYGLGIAYINDHLEPRHFVAASSSAILVNGIGAASGPLLATFVMNFAGTDIFFALLSMIFSTLTLYGFYRVTRREAVPMEEQGDFIAMPVRPTPFTMTVTEEGQSILQEMEAQEKNRGS
jgi:MFS family permease